MFTLENYTNLKRRRNRIHQNHERGQEPLTGAINNSSAGTLSSTSPTPSSSLSALTTSLTSASIATCSTAACPFSAVDEDEEELYCRHQPHLRHHHKSHLIVRKSMKSINNHFFHRYVPLYQRILIGRDLWRRSTSSIQRRLSLLPASSFSSTLSSVAAAASTSPSSATRSASSITLAKTRNSRTARVVGGGGGVGSRVRDIAKFIAANNSSRRHMLLILMLLLFVCFVNTSSVKAANGLLGKC